MGQVSFTAPDVVVQLLMRDVNQKPEIEFFKFLFIFAKEIT